MKQPEQKVVDAILRHVKGERRPDTFLYRVSTGRTGWPDLLGAYHGRPLVVEVKQPGREPRPEQAAWLERLQAGGYVAIVAHSLDEFLERVQHDTVETSTEHS